MYRFRRIFSVVLILLLVLSNGTFAFANTGGKANPIDASELTKKSLLDQIKKIEDPTLDANFNDSEKVRVIVELDGETPLEYANKKGVMYKSLAKPTKESLTTKVEKQQKAAKNAISSKGVDISYNYDYAVSFNGFSGEVEFGNIEKIEAVPNVKEVYLANEYNRPIVEPNMDTSHEYIQSHKTWADAEIKGEGMVVAVIDTGVDPSHRDFVLSDSTEEDLTKKEVKTIIGEGEVKGKYYTEKVPFGYNYYDQNDTILDLGPAASEHGMHVAGTVAANGDPQNGGIKGVAPEAQVLGMKVFSNDPNFPSTWSDVYLAAIDDAIALGADVLNMSLGSTASFYEANSPEDLAITRAVENGIVSAISAGNSGHIGYGWDNPFYQNPDIGVVGAPGLNPDSISVAASGNTAYLYQHNISVGDFEATGYGVDDWTELAASQELEVVSLSQLKGVEEVPGTSCKVCGTPEEFESVDVEGKVVLVKRGTLAFIDKTNNAADAGAVGIIVYDHGTSQFYEDQGGWAIPFTMIHAEDGAALEDAIAAGASTLDISKINSKESPEMGRMTAFTSWGTTPSLELKPEITAPGGNIYSTLNDDQYGVMSGTSMAAPHVAGGSALVQQYLQKDDRFEDLTIEERTRLAKVMLMNTANIIQDLNDQPFSPRRQGAGMMQLLSAVRTPVTVVESSSNEAKVELKDFQSKTFDMTFTAENISDKDVTYNVDTSVLADTLQKTATDLEYNALIAGNMKDVNIDSPESITVPAGESIEFTVTVDLKNAKIPGLDVDGNPTTFDLRENIFVEGYVKLIPEDNTIADLSVPYVGFYGEWDEPEVLDGIQDLGEERFYNFDKLFGPGVGHDMLFGDEGYFVAPVEVDGKKYYPVSPNGDGLYDTVYPLPAFMRNAAEVQFNILGENNKQLRRVLIENDVRKTYFDGGSGSYYSFNPNRQWDGTNLSNVVEDGVYYYEIKSLIDYEGADWQSDKYPLYVDTTGPEVNATYNADTGVLAIDATDSGVGILEFSVTVDGELLGYVPAGTTKVNLPGLSEGTKIEVEAFDHAANETTDVVSFGDNELPIIYVDKTAPEAYGAYNTLEVPVSGYVQEDVALESFTVNDKEVEVTKDGNKYKFSTVVTFKEDGAKDIHFKAVDNSGKEFDIKRPIFVDTTKAEIEYDVPKVVDHNVDSIKVDFNLTDNFNYLSLKVNDDHVYELPFKTPADIINPADEIVEHTLSLKPGDNVFKLTLEDVAGNVTTEEFTVYRNESESRVDRIAGATLYHTSVEVSQAGWEKSDTVVLARGDRFGDALAGIPLAKKYNAPLLLTESDKFTKVTKKEIARLGAKTVYILGGELAVGKSVEDSLESQGITVHRIGGENRFETSVNVAKEVVENGSANEVVVVNGMNFPDALSIGSYAAMEGLPIILVNGEELPQSAERLMYDLGVNKTLVVGGPSVVSKELMNELPHPFRVAGGNRYETAIAVAEYFDLDTNHYYVATGRHFADGLSSGALAAKNGEGILLVTDHVPEVVEDFITENNLDLLTAIGGPIAISEDVEKALNKLLGQ
ncbi:cell wall-binding repeat-containing protein [Virgibacillus necropolis]|uniref:Lactocepin n=1 Tax=Virgibacillus necropolis TaxID=163877 RepID=A0A221M8Z6_9BACI|nr:cell wall-binding repeat-containing protein [Virgibacillus necropolis]ASN04118.1 lactocepin precursor [Virgibacillus necropolis]